jgi:ABC-type Zn uptake system ZnuABC Zn-binding protein ZnuA
VAPSPAYLNKLIKLIEDRDVRILVREPREAEKNLAFLAEKTGARIVLLAGSVGAAPGVDDYFSLFDFNVKALLAAREPRS